MSDGPKLPVALRDERERVIAVLSEAFAQDRLSIEEFDERLTLAHAASTVAEVTKLAEDLPQQVAARPAPAERSLVPLAEAKPAQKRLIVFSGDVREGKWQCPQKLAMTCVFGGVVLDFREARLPAGPIEVTINSYFGGAQIIVPPELPVEVDGSAIFGGFEHMARSPAEPEPDRPILRITGRAVFGGVSIETRLAGETEGDARRRRRRERKQHRRQLRGR
jgi:hypothetical protein